MIEKGPWHLGRFGPAINLVAMLWVLFISVVLSVPDNLRPGKTIVGLMAILAIWYAVRERRRFAGPAWAAELALAPAAETAVVASEIETR
ncbi:MAG TPA: hypothetical protein VEZ90_19750 [Blastocatellia bacterium]|nr:hypothetical protein [Blastocatellia bacterium]